MSAAADSITLDPAEAEALAIARRWRLLVMSLLLVAVLLRLLAAVLVDRHVQQAGRLFLIEGDANGYWELGRRIASGQDYSIYTPPRRILRVPGFPLLLAGCIRLFGDSVLPARIVLAFVGTACCALTYLLGRMLFMRRVGFWACLFVAVNPLQVGNSVLILSETWFTFWMLLTLLLMAYVFQAKAAACDTSQKEAGLCGWRLGLVTCGLGACIGITTLIRPGFLPWVIITVGGLLVLLKRSAGIRLYVSVTTVAGCLLVMSPWAVRNLEVSGHLVWTSLWSGPSLYDGLNPQATGASDMRFFDEERLLSRMSEFEMNQQYKDRAVEFARQNPGRAVELGVAKAGRFLNPVPNLAQMSNWGVRGVCVAYYLAFWGLGGLALMRGLLSRSDLLILAGPFLLFLLIHVVFVGSMRYRLPVEYPLAVIAAAGLRDRLASR